MQPRSFQNLGTKNLPVSYASSALTSASLFTDA